MNPFTPPLAPNVSTLPSIPTRGPSSGYFQVGVLHMDTIPSDQVLTQGTIATSETQVVPNADPTGETTPTNIQTTNQITVNVDNRSNANKMLPLFAEETYRGSNRYRYFTQSDGYHPVKLPVRFKSRDCQEEQGCEEIYSDERVDVSGYNLPFKASLYKKEGYRYSPDVL